MLFCFMVGTLPSRVNMIDVYYISIVAKRAIPSCADNGMALKTATRNNSSRMWIIGI